MGDILVYTLHYDGRVQQELARAPSPRPRELAAELGGEAHALVLGDASTTSCARRSAATARRGSTASPGPEGLAQPVVDAMAALVGERGFSYALFGGGLLGFEIGAGLAARLGAGVAMEVTAVGVRDGAARRASARSSATRRSRDRVPRARSGS